MNGISISHWGIISWPDNEWNTNCWLHSNGELSKLDDYTPMKFQTKVRPINLEQYRRPTILASDVKRLWS